MARPMGRANGPTVALVGNRILVLYGSYRSDRKGVRLADFAVRRLCARGENAELIDAKAIGLPILDRMLKEYAPGTAPAAMESLGTSIREADAFLFVVGEYNWGVQPGLKNLTDHFLEEWFWRPAAIASYSAGRLSGTRASYAWRNTLSEMGMVVISSTLTVGPIAATLDETGEPIGEAGAALEGAFSRFADDLAWWTEAAKNQRGKRATPY
jgi:NAD(P)H-dependent FMN reductase